MTGLSLLANDRSVSLWVNLSMCVFVCIDISVCHDPPVAAEFSRWVVQPQHPAAAPLQESSVAPSRVSFSVLTCLCECLSVSAGERPRSCRV